MTTLQAVFHMMKRDPVVESYIKSQAQKHRRSKEYWPFRAIKGLAWSLVASSLFMLYVQVSNLRSLFHENPHYQLNTCSTCHEHPETSAQSGNCFSCHDKETLVPFPDTVASCELGKKETKTVVTLCTHCHDRGGYMVVVHKDGRVIDVDVASTHPVNLTITDKTFPAVPLPLRDGKIINCVTCHDVHTQVRGKRLLRMTDFVVGGRDPGRLCHNCHHSNGVL